MTHFQLRLYVTGRTGHSQRAIDNLRALCERDLRDGCEVEVIDVRENPELAEQDGILATPTLVRRMPGRVRKIIGDLSDRRKVLVGLDVEPAGGTRP